MTEVMGGLRTGLASSLTTEEMAPVSAVPAAQGQTRQESGEKKPPRREPPPENVSEEPSEEPSAEDTGLPQHRIDSIA